MTVSIKSYADVQSVLKALVGANSLPIAGAPHGAFYNTLTYAEFTTGNVPGTIPGGPFKILEVGSSRIR